MRLPKIIINMYSFTRAAITMYHKLGGFNRNLLSEDWKSKIKVLAEPCFL